MNPLADIAALARGITGWRLGTEPADAREHFYCCKACGQMVDRRQLGEVLHHEVPGHTPLMEN